MPLLLRRGGGQKPLERIALQRSDRERRSQAPKKSKNLVQPEVEQHHINANDPQSSSKARYINEIRISEIPDNLILGNHEEGNRRNFH
jgi:hypothetical protein